MFGNKRLDEIKRIKEMQANALEDSQTDYMIGLYNGLEFAVAIMEDRKPDFVAIVREPEVIDRTDEDEEQTKRTKFSGVRRRL